MNINDFIITAGIKNVHNQPEKKYVKECVKSVRVRIVIVFSKQKKRREAFSPRAAFLAAYSAVGSCTAPCFISRIAPRSSSNTFGASSVTRSSGVAPSVRITPTFF